MKAKIGEFRKVPGPKAEEVIEKTKKYLATTTNDSNLVVNKGEGVILIDPDGNQYLDFTSGIGCANIGHSNPEVAKAIYRQALTLSQYINTDFHNTLPNKLAYELKMITPGNFEKKVFFSNSGTEAVEAAIKLVFANHQTHNKAEFIAFWGAFHGRTGYALPLMDSRKRERVEYYPMTYPAHRYRFPVPGIAEKVYENMQNDPIINSGRVAALVFEPVQGEGGIIVPDGKILKKIVELCREKGIFIIADEVQTGFGRTGKMFACEHFNIEPDILCLAKTFGMGVPAGATVFRAELDWNQLGRHSNTNGGNNLAMAAALKGIEIIKKDLVNNSAQIGQLLFSYLKELKLTYPRFIKEARGLGLMQAVEFVSSELRDMVIKEALSFGLVLIGAGNPSINPSIRLMPPLIINEEQVKVAMEIFKSSINTAIKNI